MHTPDSFTLALAQMDAVLGNKQANLATIEQYCCEAAEQKAQIICFPELATTGYRPDLLQGQLWDLSEYHNGQTSKLLTKLSQKLQISIICGFAERGDYTGQVYNSAGVWTPDRNEINGIYRKVHAFGQEKQWFAGGKQYPVFRTPVGKVGIMICYDMGFPEVARALAMQGAEIIFVPSAWCIQDQDMWDINLPCRALENTIYVAGCNRCGAEESLRFFGGSKLVGPRGQIIKQAKNSDKELLFCDVDLNLQAHTRLTIPYLRDRREETYQVSL